MSKKYKGWEALDETKERDRRVSEGIADWASQANTEPLKESSGWTPEAEKAFDSFSSPVQCGDCYNWYDAVSDFPCPCCGGEDWVGSR